MPTYPIYRQTWDGGTGSYPPGHSDWTLGTGYAVDTTSTLTSSPDGLHCTATTPLYATAYKPTAESSADGTLTVYFTTPSWSTVAGSPFGILARVQGNYPVDDGSVDGYSVYFTDINHNALRVYRNTDGVIGQTSAFLSGSATNGVIYVLEFRLSGSSIKVRMRRRSDGYFLNTASVFVSTVQDAISITDTGVSSAGRIGVSTNLGPAGSAYYIDDIIWDAPAPILSQSTASLPNIGNTVQLTAGGFSDPLAGVTWASNDTGVATVDSSGLVTAVAGGRATITATGVADTNQTSTCDITVADMTSFSKAINNIATTVASAYTAASGSLTVADASGITLSTGEWVRVSTFRSGVPLSILKATAVSGNVLTIDGAAPNESTITPNPYADVNLLVGDAAELRVTAGIFTDLGTAINDLETSIASIESNGYITPHVTSGAPTSTPPAGAIAVDPTNRYIYMYTGSSWVKTAALT